MRRRMSATDIKAALHRAAESGSSELTTKIVQSPPGRLKKMTKDYNNKTFDVKMKTIMKRKLGLASCRDYITLYIVYRSIFPYMNLDLYKSLLRELSVDTRLKQFRKSLKASMSTNQRKRQRGGFIFSAIIASIAAGIAWSGGYHSCYSSNNSSYGRYCNSWFYRSICSSRRGGNSGGYSKCRSYSRRYKKEVIKCIQCKKT